MFIFVSYFSGIKGMVMSEWAEDKLLVSGSVFQKTYLITSVVSDKRTRDNVRVVRIPSLSWKDFSWELSEYLKTSNTNFTFLILWRLLRTSTVLLTRRCVLITR